MLKLQGTIALPPHVQAGGFDHAAMHLASHRMFVAHTANDALDVIDTTTDRYLESIPGLPGVAGALVSEADGQVFTSNRGENTVGIFSADNPALMAKVPVDLRPNGLAYDPVRQLLIAAHVGDPALPGSFTVAVVDVARRQKLASVPVPGRTRWAIFDPLEQLFYVNISNPPCIVVIDPLKPAEVSRQIDIQGEGPHGLDLDVRERRLYCACDGRQLIALNPRAGEVFQKASLGGTPDVIFLNPALGHLYVAIGDPGMIETYDAKTLARLETLPTERGAHTFGFDASQNKIVVFLPQTHQAAVYLDQE